MASRLGERHEWELPHLREAHQVPSVSSDLWSVKFYPYTEPGVDPVFAVVGGKNIIICRTPPAAKESRAPEIIQVIVEEEPDSDYFACVWTKDLESGIPLLCIAGTSAKIKIFNALTGKLHRTLAGHGGDINDLVISPVNPEILASGSEDSTVRIWSLDPAHEKQPCAAILAGDGHKETILTLSLHANGRFLLSGGIDHIINLWTLPEFPNSKTGTNKTTRIHYPHFSTSEVHSDIVDCITFHGDLILSKAANENCIVLWNITGFASTNTPPPLKAAPTTHDSQRDTRSWFSNSSSSGPSTQYSRLLQFSIPDSEIIFMRFGLYPGSSTTNPVLAMCNTASKIFFWDFARLEAYLDYITALPASSTTPTVNATSSFSSSSSNLGPNSSQNQEQAKRPPFLIPFKHRNRGGGMLGAFSKTNLSHVRDSSPTDSASSHQTGSDGAAPQSEKDKERERDREKEDREKSRELWAKKYDMGDPLNNIAPHKEEVVKGLSFLGRQVAWSGNGEWCVVVGSSGVIAVFQRWGK